MCVYSLVWEGSYVTDCLCETDLIVRVLRGVSGLAGLTLIRPYISLDVTIIRRIGHQLL
jgi:hypothetical protein